MRIYTFLKYDVLMLKFYYCGVILLCPCISYYKLIDFFFSNKKFKGIGFHRLIKVRTSLEANRTLSKVFINHSLKRLLYRLIIGVELATLRVNQLLINQTNHNWLN